jgi:hypothetical protein
MRIVSTAICCLLLLGVFASLVQAGPRVISLNLMSQSPLQVYQNAPIKLSNTFKTNLYDLTVSKPAVSKKILSVAEFLSGESFDLAFSKVGAYEVCFSRIKNEARTCLKLDVLKRISA